MSVRSSALALVLGLCAVLLVRPAFAQRPAATLITGTVLGSDSLPLKVGDVHLGPESRPRQLADAPIAADGRFAIATTLTGPVRLTITGVDHYPVSVPLMLGAPATIALDVRLKHYEYTDSLERVTVIGDFNRFSFSGGRPLVRQPDGRYTLEVETTADTLAYQLLGLETSGRSINGSQADRYAYDGGGDYRSVISAVNGRATVAFDPALLVRRAGEASVTFRDPASRAARFYAIYRDWSRQRRGFMDSTNAARARNDSLRYDWAPVIAQRTAALASERDPLLRQMLLLQLWEADVFARQFDAAVARRVVREVPPSSPLWGFIEFGGPQAVWLPIFVASGKRVTPQWRSDTASALAALAYLDRMVAGNPDSTVQASALGTAIPMARAVAGAARANAYFMRLEQGYPEAPELAYLRSRYSPNRVIQVGRQIPEFRFVSLDDSSVVYSRTSLLGHTYLLDFWATWCGPCVGEIPYLQAAHDSLATDGVEFLSVSLDSRPEDVRNFRQRQRQMPWLQAFAGGAFEHPDVRRLEIMGVPTTILVGPDGTILAVDLRGEHTVRDIRAALTERRPR